MTDFAQELKTTRDLLAVAVGVISQAKGLVWMGEDAARKQIARVDKILKEQDA